MKLFTHKNFEITLVRSGKGEAFRWKVYSETISDNYHRLQNGKGFKFVNTWSYYVPTTLRFFWLNMLLSIRIKPKRISGKAPKKYVEFEKTHLDLLDLPEGNWSD